MSTTAPGIVDYFRRLAEAVDRPRLENVLAEVGQLIDGAVGITRADPGEHVGPTPAFPFPTETTILAKMRKSPVAETHVGPGGSWMVCPMPGANGHALLAWAYRESPRTWSDEDCWHWTAATQALGRWLAADDADVTPAQERLELAAAVVGRLAHDFGNFLTGILGFTELSVAHAPKEGPQKQFLEEVLQSAHRGAAWIHRLQLFCRRSASQAWPTLLSSVLAMEEARLRALQAPNLRWQADIPNDLPLLAIEAGALHQAVQEVVTNAREATKDQGMLTFSARAVDLRAEDCRSILGHVAAGPHVEISIADDGPGIGPADRAKLFREIFFSTKPRQRGVGLLIVYGILQRFHGGLKLDHTGPGLRVRLYVPAATIAGPTLTNEGKAPSILLVHNNPVVFDSLRNILEANGCAVTAVDTYQTALAMCMVPKSSFALILIDLGLPQSMGLELARRILERKEKARFLFIYTQFSFHGLAEEEMLKRFELLRWPLQPAELLRAVRTALTHETPIAGK